jgi:hypothetical protein
MDDFTIYGNGGQAKMLNGLYADNGGCGIVSDPDPTGTTTVCQIFPNNGSDVMIRRVLPTAINTIGIAARYYLSELPTDTSRRPVFAMFRDVNNVTLTYVTVDPSGYIHVYNYNNGSPLLIATSSAPILITNAWRHMETKIVFSATAGSVQIKLEGVTVINVTGIITSWNGNLGQNVGPGYIRSIGSIGPNFYVKDMIIWDNSAGVVTDFIGTCRVVKIIPDSDVSLNWTPSSGTTGYNKINESGPDDDTGYITAGSPAPAPAEFTLSDLPVTTTAVRGVMAIHRSRKTDGGDGNIQLSLVSGANTGNGTDRPITTAYTYWTDMYEQDPGGTNWSKALVNALHLKLNRTV